MIYWFFPLLLSTGFIFVQDIKSRRVHFIWYLLFLTATLLRFYLEDFPIEDCLYNLLFITLVLFGAAIYFAFRRKAKNAITKFIGAGDVLLMYALVPIGSFSVYFGILEISLILSILLGIFLKIKIIPLAGWMAPIVLLYCIVIEWL